MSLRARLQSGEILVAPGAFDALTARLLEQAGFEAVYRGGYAASDPRGMAAHEICPSKLTFAFDFDIREVSEINDKSQTLSIPMYFSVSWLESRLWINKSAKAWNQSITGPKNVSLKSR